MVNKITIHKKLPKLDLNVTNRCNFRCVHCAFDSGITEMKEFSSKELERILMETKELGGERIDITGGEPLVRNDLDKIIKIGKNLDYRIELVTNGSLVTRGGLRKFKALGLDAIAISLDGSNYKVYNEIRRTNKRTFDHVVDIAKRSVEFGFYTKINTVAFKSNKTDLPNITRLCIDLGANEHGIYYFTPVGRGKDGKQYSIEPLEWLRFIRENLVNLDSEMKVSIEFPFIEKDYRVGNCDCILKEDPYHLQILPDGNVYPCAILASYKRPIGNLNKSSVGDIWNNEKLWSEYYQNILYDIFQKYGSCVDFSASFDLKDDVYKKFKFVCPLRKFLVSSVRYKGGNNG